MIVLHGSDVLPRDYGLLGNMPALHPHSVSHPRRHGIGCDRPGNLPTPQCPLLRVIVSECAQSGHVPATISRE
jgi:hypothetical protein